MKVAVIGTGRIGRTLAFLLANNKKIDELVMINRNRDIPENLRMDFISAFPERAPALKVGVPSDANDADIVLIAAGEFHSQNLYELNKKMFTDLFKEFHPQEKTKIAIIATPPDPLANIVLSLSGLKPENIIGFGGELDINRLKYLIYEDTQDYTKKLDVHHIGTHGKPGHPVFSEPVSDRKKITRDAKHYVADHLLKVGASTYATAAGMAQLAEALMEEEETVMHVAAYQKEHGLFITWPCRVNKHGATPIDLHLSDEDQKTLEELLAQRKSDDWYTPQGATQK